MILIPSRRGGAKTMTIEKINTLSIAEFRALIGPIFEHSPWIAERAWEKRPFGSREDLLQSLYGVVEAAGDAPLLDLISAHPDLVGRLAQAGKLTPESANEQKSAGLLAMDRETVERFQDLNAAYRARFGFPFIICARWNSRDTILDSFQARLGNTRAEEISTAWQEIKKIASLRLADLGIDS
ncbi:MAG: 2-oxo-4-hydroxy-4-carboxy-5-ureidoimidazoline decarboxylase [Terrimicrobiaceae bacterium]